MTVFASGGKSRTFDYQAGDVGYVPFAMGHYIENTGDEPLVFLALVSVRPLRGHFPRPMDGRAASRAGEGTSQCGRRVHREAAEEQAARPLAMVSAAAELIVRQSAKTTVASH